MEIIADHYDIISSINFLHVYSEKGKKRIELRVLDKIHYIRYLTYLLKFKKKSITKYTLQFYDNRITTINKSSTNIFTISKNSPIHRIIPILIAEFYIFNI